MNREYEETITLKSYLESVYRAIFNDVKEVKQRNKIKEAEEDRGINIDSWIDELPLHERKLADKLVKSIINHGGIETVKAGELIYLVKDYYYYEDFKDLASEISEGDVGTDKLLTIFKEWQLIEAREF